MRIFPKLYSGIFTITSVQAKWDTCKLYVDKVCIFGIINNYNWDNFKWISTTHLVNGPKYFINTKIPCTRNHHRHSNLITPIKLFLSYALQPHQPFSSMHQSSRLLLWHALLQQLNPTITWNPSSISLFQQINLLYQPPYPH